MFLSFYVICEKSAGNGRYPEGLGIHRGKTSVCQVKMNCCEPGTGSVINVWTRGRNDSIFQFNGLMGNGTLKMTGTWGHIIQKSTWRSTPWSIRAMHPPIVNLYDGSGMLLPRIVYDFPDNIYITLTALLTWGGPPARNTAGMLSRAPALPRHPRTRFQHGSPGIFKQALNLFLGLQNVEPKR